MNSHYLSTYARIALIAAVAGVMTACASYPRYYDPDPYYSARMAYYDYWYYPAIGAYYDPGARIYIYYEQDHWIRTQTLPTRMRPYLGRHVTVRSPHDRPYEEHHRHREKYQPERYRERDPAHQGYDAWIGAPRKQNLQRQRDDRRSERHDQDRNGNDRRHDPERGTVPVPSRYRDPASNAAPLKREDKSHQPAIRQEGSREQYRNGDVRRKNQRQKEDGRPSSSPGQSRQYRAPDSRRQIPKTPPRAAPGHQSPPTKTAPPKRDEKRQQRDNRKDDTQDRYREEGDATSPKRQRKQFERYEQYR